jgi:flagellar biosynthetic protein FliR
MDIRIDPLLVVTVLLSSIRLLTFFLVAPPFAGPTVPARVKVGLAVALSLLTADHIETGSGLLELPQLLLGVLYQVGVGAALGFVVLVCFSVVQSAGALVDFGAAFSGAVLYDPFSQAGASPMARLYQLMATTMLFTSGGVLLFVAGIVRSFEAAPVSGMEIGSVGELLSDRIGNFLAAALQIAFPLLAALFMAELVLGLLARAAPQLNLLVVGFGVKSLIVIFLGAIALPLLPFAVHAVVDTSMRAMATALG